MTADDIPKKKMALHKGTLPGLEFNSKGQLPLVERKAGDQEKTTAALHDALHADDDGIKNPENEAAIPGEMPPNQQGQGPDYPPHHDLEGQQGGTRGGDHE